VVQTKPRQEVIAETNLQRQSFEVYYPQIIEPRLQRGRWKEVIQPLFPRYLFVRLDLSLDNTAPIRSTQGVTTLVKFGELIRPLTDGFIEELKATADPETSLHQSQAPLFQQGDDVTIVTGPLAGLKGVFQANTGTERVAVLLEILGRTNTVFLKQDSVAPSHCLA
jgi:transcriptional antiterminator RfaH